MNGQTPQEIKALIEFAEEDLEKQAHQRADDEAVQKLKAAEEAYDKAHQLWTDVLPQIPDVLQPYVMLNNPRDKDQYPNSWDEEVLEFQVPGLAPIAAIYERKNDRWEFDRWVVAGAVGIGWDEEDNLNTDVDYSFFRGACHEGNTKTPLYHTLRVASQVASQLQDKKSELALERALAKRRAAEREAEEKQQRDEERALFEAIKRDPILVHMLKAFVYLRDEREEFERQLQDADETMYGIENRWSQKAAELRRQADDAQRRAEEDRLRLQSDLEDTEAKLKKAERGW